MLLQGLRSQEVLDLNREDLLLSESQIRVRGKGKKTRFLPLAPEALNCWITTCGWSGPQTSTNALFVSLKGPARGTRMTPAGLRSLFRHHRRTTGVKMPTRTGSGIPLPRTWFVPASACRPSCS